MSAAELENLRARLEEFEEVRTRPMLHVSCILSSLFVSHLLSFVFQENGKLLDTEASLRAELAQMQVQVCRRFDCGSQFVAVALANKLISCLFIF